MKKSQMKRWICAMTTLVLAVGLSAPCRAMTRPDFIPISGPTEFLAWYRAGGGECMVTGELVVRDNWVLDGSWFAGVNLLNAPIRVVEGGSLTIRNPQFCLAGAPNVICLIRVEQGGRLCLEAGGIYGRPGTDVVEVAQGGVVERSTRFLLEGNLSDQNDETPPPANDSLQPNPPTSVKPEPEPEPEPIPIEALHEPILQVESVRGQSPVEVALPNTVQVRLSRETGDLAALAVEWDLSSVPFDTPGAYTVYGDFIPDGLSFKGISNPKGLRPVVSLTILASNPVWDLVWGIAEPVSGGLGLVRLSFSPLPEDVEHLYLQRSTDGVRWSRCAGQNRPQDADLLSDVTTRSGMSILTSRQRMEPTGFYLRLEVVGSLREGTSNITYVPAVADGDDGSYDGNRGGIQGTFDREGQKEPEEIPTPSERVVGTTPPQAEYTPHEALSEQAAPHETEAGEVRTEQELCLSESTGSGGWSGYYHELSEEMEQPVAQPLIRHESDSAEEAVPEAPRQSADVAATPEETEESQPAPDTDPPTVEQTLAVEHSAPAPQGDGDTNGFVAAATLAVCLLGAAGLYLLHKHSIKRKS